MANGTRTLTLLVVLVVGLAVGWFIGHGQAPPAPPPTPTPVPTAPLPTPAPTPRVTPPPPYPVAKNWKLTVGPDPCQVTEGGQPVPVAAVSKRGKQSIRYEPASGEELLGILFEGNPQPFKNVAYCGNGPTGVPRWALVCESKNVCVTGPALGNVPDNTYYKTDQILAGKPPCDAGIIIQP